MTRCRPAVGFRPVTRFILSNYRLERPGEAPAAQPER